ncbi:MAG: hypothetical protein Q7K43_05425 [Candidatus Woesearchaeota archaeon]|nr:hypothetical protein [Candidatus Woesearchaeota archaeon]
MDLKNKQKNIRTIDSADQLIAQLEEKTHPIKSQEKTPSKEDIQLLKSIYHAIEILKTNPFAGTTVSHKNWPKNLELLPNIFSIDLSQNWKLLYYVTGTKVTIISVIFEICNKKKYDELFGKISGSN